MLTNFHIMDIASAMKFPLEKVCFKNELCKEPLKYNVCYIINSQNSEDEQGEDNEGAHWLALYVEKTKDGKVHPQFFDSYGAPPAKEITDFVRHYVPYSTKDIQSIMDSVCGFYCLAFCFFVSKSKFRTGNIYQDTETFLELFNDLNVSHDFKQNEFVLQCFFDNPFLKESKK